MSKYVALIIDTLNHDLSISDLLNPAERIHRAVSRYNEGIPAGQNEDFDEQESSEKDGPGKDSQSSNPT